MKQSLITQTLSDLGPTAIAEIESHLRHLLADTFTLYVKTKSFHWHVYGRHFNDFHRMLDDQASEIFAMTDQIAERARKLGGVTLRSIADISSSQRLRENERQRVAPLEMIEELLADNQQFVKFLRSTHNVCDSYGDVATASLIEVWIDEAEQRAWFLSAISSEHGNTDSTLART